MIKKKSGQPLKSVAEKYEEILSPIDQGRVRGHLAYEDVIDALPRPMESRPPPC